ncbi:MAG: putative Fe-S cluster assembly protein SufT [Verrucomicrobia bacterium]|nr:putative Fe-S cluster assembly protein SufT [Verrucomicrobiota bacterium]
MPNDEPIQLRRGCEAILIPSGEKVRLEAGLPVTVAQSLGGSYTVVADGRLARIDSKDVDALGFTPPPPPAATQSASSGPVDEQLVWKQLKTCYDPEIPVNIVELGLIYDLRIAPQPDGSQRVEVKMTLTAPGCGMGAMIADDVQRKILDVPGVSDAKVELVFDPPWNQAMMSDAARLELGLM